VLGDVAEAFIFEEADFLAEGWVGVESCQSFEQKEKMSSKVLDQVTIGK
jgi:hypothetical protein